MASPTTTRIEGSGGTGLSVRVWDGTGVPFVLVHGLASNARLWDGVAARLAAKGHAVAAVDQRGHGRSDKPDDGYDYETVCADLVAVITALGFERPVVAGQSWGGNVVMELAARHPDLVRGVVAVDGGWLAFAHFGSWEEVAERLAPPQLEGRPLADMERGMRSWHPDWPEEGIEGALANFEIREDGTVAPWLSRDRHMKILRSMWEEKIDTVWPKVSVPALLIPCDDGGSWSARKRDEVGLAERALPVSRTVWFRASHDVHAERPDDIAALFAECVEEGFFT